MRQLLSSAAFVLWASSAAASASCVPDKVDLRDGWGTATFNIELADTPQERSRGLMFREDLAPDAGMLFVYERPQRAVFWMKNTLIPLDMIFINDRGKIVHVHHEAIPGDLTGIDGGDDVLAVLEINGGLARELGIVVGGEVRHPALPQESARWPC